MSDKEIKVSVKVPLFEDWELKAVDTFTNEIARKYNEVIVKEKEQIITQRIIHNLQERIDKSINYLEKVTNGDLFMYGRNYLLDILKGSDE